MSTLTNMENNASEGDIDHNILSTLESGRKQFVEAMDDDFNTAAALAALFEQVREVNTIIKETPSISKASIIAAKKFFHDLAGDVLGLFPKQETESRDVEPFINMILETRQNIRKLKQWQEADRIRDQLSELGISIEDGKDGSVWRFKE